MLRKLLTIAALGCAMLLMVGSIYSSHNVMASQDDGFADKGRVLFNKHCAVCHGQDARGNGPAASQLKKQPADLTVIQKRGEKFPTYKIMTMIEGEKVVPAHGTREMPIWGTVFRRTQDELRAEAYIYSLAKYLESIQRF